MSDHRDQSGLVWSLIASLLLHVTVVVPVWMVAMNTPSDPHHEPELTSTDVLQSPPEDPLLGLDAPNPSSLTWIGYDEYEEHIAALADFEQASFTEQPGEQVEPAQPQPSQREPVEPAEAVEPAEPVLEPIFKSVEAVEPLLDPAPAPQLPSDLPPQLANVPEERSSGDLQWVRSLLKVIEQTMAQPQPDVVEQPSDVVQPEAAPEPPATEPPQPERAESTPPAEPGGDPGDAPATPSDRESDAASTIEADPEHWRDGQPLASQGVEIKPQRPHFTLLQRMTASPGNPLVLIKFQPNGVPQSASFVEGSGSASVDAAIEASLYRWRASGESIDQLIEGKTFDVTIRIVLNRRAPK